MKEWITSLLDKGKLTGKASGLVVVLGIGGMLLILLSEFLPAGSASVKAQAQPDMYEYETKLESRLESLIGQVDGAGKVQVMVALESGEESVYAVDTQQGEADSQQTHVLLNDGSALTETVRLPQISGVAVVCEGGGEVHVVAQITEMLSSLLDLPANRISVAKMN